MSLNKPEKKTILPFSFSQLSIQQRLPLLICALLLSVIIIFGAVSYFGVRRAAVKEGHARLQTLTDQLSSMLSASSGALISATRISAGQNAIKKYLQSNGKDSAQEVSGMLEKIREDTSTVLVQLLNRDRITILSSGKNGIRLYVNIDSILPSIRPDTGTTGKIFAIQGLVYYPIIVPVIADKEIAGYLLRWRRISTSSKALEQLSQLMGTEAKLYIGNDDGKLWTDMMKIVPALPLSKQNTNNIKQYSGINGIPMMAAVRPIPNTPWLVSLEMSQQKILVAAHRFLYWIIITGIVLIAAGILLAWIMSRNITRPLNKLTVAASAITAGDYSSLVKIDRHDELGKLADTFNTMALQVKHSQDDLEKKVQDRTAKLEAANKELEAFSYSVSHDLRAPLRAISGYSMILKEDYATKLDAEANRIIDISITNVKMMGQLIDDLIAFSQMGKNEAMYDAVDMKILAESCIAELFHYNKENKYEVIINHLPCCHGNSSMIKQVWVNLIGNAIKYSSKELNPRIEIGCKEDESSMHVYFVRDNGIGFDMQYAHKLFGVFQRLHNQEEFEGTGVGLALVKRIIDKHKGQVWAESTSGEGAVFYFSLPANDN
jgi:signal transduction histidine kinase